MVSPIWSGLELACGTVGWRGLGFRVKFRPPPSCACDPPPFPPIGAAVVFSFGLHPHSAQAPKETRSVFSEIALGTGRGAGTHSAQPYLYMYIHVHNYIYIYYKDFLG